MLVCLWVDRRRRRRRGSAVMKSLLFELQQAAEELVLCVRMKSLLPHPSAPDLRSDLIPFPFKRRRTLRHAD